MNVKFPHTLKQSDGGILNLKPQYFLLMFKNEMEDEKISRMFGKRFGKMKNEFKDKVKEHGPKINHTKTRIWGKFEKSTPVTEMALSQFDEEFRNEISSIGPVYALGETEDLINMVCLLPNIVLLKGIEEYPSEKQNELLNFLSKIGIAPNLDKTEYLKPFWLFDIEVNASINSLQLDEYLQNSKYSDLEVKYEMVPMVIPIDFTPNDNLFPDQWNMNIVQSDILDEGWALTTGNPNVVIAIFDTGCDLTHPDLDFFSNGVDLGTMTGVGDPYTGRYAYHGTACAGVAAANINNTSGVAGMAGNCLILPIAFSTFSDVEFAAGINYARRNGADIVSMSFHLNVYDPDITDTAIENAHEAGLIMMAASGNNNSSTINGYPSTHQNVMAIGASDQDDNRKNPDSPDNERWGSNYADGISVVAPGVLIPTTDIQGAIGSTGNDYNPTFNGTSSATPHVAGLAGLVKSLCPSGDPEEIRNIIEKTADKVGSIDYVNDSKYPNGTRNYEMGYGRINVRKAVKESFLLLQCTITD